MGIWGIVLLSIDFVLMAGILALLAKGRVPVLGSMIASGAGSVSSDTLGEELESELEAARKASEELELSKRECETYKKDLKEKNRVLTRLIGEARMKASADDSRLTAGGDEMDVAPPSDEDLYGKAARMCAMGTPPEKIAESLGMLAGEAELVSSINNFRT